MNYFYKSGNGACRRAIDKFEIFGDEIDTRKAAPQKIETAAVYKTIERTDGNSRVMSSIVEEARFIK